MVKQASVGRWSLLFWVVATACSSDADPPPPAPEPEQPDGAPTYYGDVLPLLNRSCVGCHSEGGIAPFSLTDYESARDSADMIASVTERRIMPPMPVDNSGECNTYSNARWLSESEIDLLGRWAAAKAPIGDASLAEAPPAPEPQFQADATLDIGVEYMPDDAAGHDDYRCFVVPAPVSEAAFLSRYQVFPGDTRVVHHVIVYQPDDDAEAAAARALDQAEPGEGYTCFGSSRIAASPLALWAPGGGAVILPEGTGVKLAGGRELVIQIHYNLVNGAHPDRTRVGLGFATAPVTEAQYSPVLNTGLMLQPGRDLVTSTDVAPLASPASFKIYGAMPHMHTLGRTLRVEAETKSGTECLVNVDRWNFHWQNAWWYSKPLALEDVSSLSIRCGYDTRSRTDVVTWGESTSDEMCISYFYISL